MNNLFKILNNLFEYKEPVKYEFTVPERPNEEENQNLSYEKEIALQKIPNEAEKVFSSISDNLNYMKVKYNALINSDVFIREFTVTARNKEYKYCLSLQSFLHNLYFLNYYNHKTSYSYSLLFPY